ncbi:hypothetical protein Tco_0782834, partial [Tanacetum coccineum]
DLQEEKDSTIPTDASMKDVPVIVISHDELVSPCANNNNNEDDSVKDGKLEYDDEFPIRFKRTKNKTLTSKTTIHRYSLIDGLTDEDFDEASEDVREFDNLIDDEAKEDLHDANDEESDDGQDLEHLLDEPTDDVDDFDSFIDDEASVDDATEEDSDSSV